MPATGSRTDPYVGSHFFIEIDGVDHGGFTECAGLQVETEVTDYAEGGNNGFVHKLAGRTKWTNLTLKWGTTDSVALWEWYQKVTQGQVEQIGAPQDGWAPPASGYSPPPGGRGGKPPPPADPLSWLKMKCAAGTCAKPIRLNGSARRSMRRPPRSPSRRSN